jgi:protein TonB
MAVAVDAEGAPISVTVLHDPGNGFGEVARACAMNMHFVPARDRTGRPTAGTTAPFAITFEAGSASP